MRGTQITKCAGGERAAPEPSATLYSNVCSTYCVGTMAQKRIQKHRGKWTRRPTEQTFEDQRTKRRRTRAEQLREQLEEADHEIDEALKRRFE